MKERKGIRHDMVSFICEKCGHLNEKEVANFLKQKYECSFSKERKKAKVLIYLFLN